MKIPAFSSHPPRRPKGGGEGGKGDVTFQFPGLKAGAIETPVYMLILFSNNSIV
jgi:hypothetical protein